MLYIRLKIIPIIIVITTLICSCAKESNLSTFTIRQGDHWASPLTTQLYSDSTLQLQVQFTESCLYDESAQEYPGWNKLGYWYNGIHPHFMGNGVTFVWRCIDGELTLGWYGWINGVSPMDTKWNGTQFGQLCKVQPNQTYLLKVITGDSIEFVVDGVISKKTKFNFKPNKLLPPYFGGLETAPHDVHIIRNVL